MKLIDEAVQDARLIQESAARIAQERLVDALSPKLKQIIESRLLSEESLEFEDIIGDLDDDVEDITADEEVGIDGDDEQAVMIPDEEVTTFTLGADDDDDDVKGSEFLPNIQVNASGEVEIELNLDDDDDDENHEDDVLTGASVIEARATVKRILRTSAQLRKRANQAKTLREAKKISESVDALKLVLSTFMRSNILTTNDASMGMIQEAFTSLTTTQERMDRIMKRRRIMEKRYMDEMAHEGDDMHEMEELDELDAVLNLTPDDDEEAEMLDDLDLGALDITVDVDDEGEDEGEGGDDFDLDLDVADEAEGDEDDESGDMMDDDDEVIEIDEAVLRQALAEMRGRRSRRSRRLAEDAVDAASSYGGGVAGDEAFIEVDEDMLINVLADELGRVSAVGAAAPAVVESRRRARNNFRRRHTARAQRVSEGVSADRRRLAEASRENNKLKRQLQEMNLFSAKLLYVNKIFNGKNVTAKQRRAIVEALDNAKTLREAKLLYRSILQSIDSKKSTDRLSESTTRVLGSSSRTTPSAQPASNGVETDRWATLAGLKEDK